MQHCLQYYSYFSDSADRLYTKGNYSLVKRTPLTRFWMRLSVSIRFASLVVRFKMTYLIYATQTMQRWYFQLDVFSWKPIITFDIFLVNAFGLHIIVLNAWIDDHNAAISRNQVVTSVQCKQTRSTVSISSQRVQIKNQDKLRIPRNSVMERRRETMRTEIYVYKKYKITKCIETRKTQIYRQWRKIVGRLIQL